MKKLLITGAVVMFLSIAAKAQTVYTSEKGEKYHTADCRLSGNAEGVTLENAKKSGKKACEMCKPDELGKAKLEQCTGKTKDGKRFKRMTGNKSKKCHQHTS